jgi:hypothetical protein
MRTSGSAKIPTVFVILLIIVGAFFVVKLQKKSLIPGLKKTPAQTKQDQMHQKEAEPEEAMEKIAQEPVPAPQAQIEAKQVKQTSAAKQEPQKIKTLKPAKVTLTGKSADGVCVPIEYRATLVDNITMERQDWEQILHMVDSVKKELMAWITNNEKTLKTDTAQLLKERFWRLHILKASASHHPDLNWRGVGVLDGTTTSDPTLWLGGGLLDLVKKNPQRARFELARILAQLISPCQAPALETYWDDYLKCAEPTIERSCAYAGISETGWATSTALAAVVSPPDCALPAFRDGKALKCLQLLSPPAAKIANDKGGAK